MQPKPIHPTIYNHDERYIRDAKTGLIWYRCPYRTLYADTDRSEIVYHSNYLRYFEVGRTSLMRDAAYSYREIEQDGYVYPIVETQLNYFKPLYYDDLIWIYTRPGTLERVKLQFDYMITLANSNVIICQGYTKHCALNSSGVPVQIDDKTVYLWNNFPKLMK